MKNREHKFVFVGGIHRSGTTALARLISSHPDVSGFENTGVREDEGQYLQSVYPTEAALGGTARFGFHDFAHMTEETGDAVTTGQKLFSEWAPYWDTSKLILCEKTPSNLIRSRFLQAAFPNSSFVFILRHPMVCALALLKWRPRMLLSTSIRNWLFCHRHLREDLQYINRSMLLRYEVITREPSATARSLEEFLGLSQGMQSSLLKGGANGAYYEKWRGRCYRRGPQEWRNVGKRIWSELEIRYITHRYEKEINEFGYSFYDSIDRDAMESQVMASYSGSGAR